MKSKNFLIYIVASLVFIISTVSIVEAYQKLHEPNIVYIEYVKAGMHNTISMYESAANTLIENVGEDCFHKMHDPENLIKNERYALSNTGSCHCDGGLFSMILKFYKEALKSPSSECVGDMTTKADYVEVIEGGNKTVKRLSIEADKVKRIMTELKVIEIKKKN